MTKQNVIKLKGYHEYQKKKIRVSLVKQLKIIAKETNDSLKQFNHKKIKPVTVTKLINLAIVDLINNHTFKKKLKNKF